jgi:hypothetical protein
MPKSYKTEVCVSGEWSTNGCRYATEAVEAGKELLSRWWVPTDSRAAESDDPVNYRFNFDTYRPEMLPEKVVVLEQPQELAAAA